MTKQRNAAFRLFLFAVVAVLITGRASANVAGGAAAGVRGIRYWN